MLEKIKNRSDFLYGAMFTWFILSSFIVQKFYGITTKFATLIIFAVLIILAFMQGCFKQMTKKDMMEAAAAGLTMVIAAANLVIIKSGKGAFFVPADLALMLFLVPRISFSEGLKRYVTGVGASLMIWWYAYVHWEYGFNMAGLIYMIFMLMGEIFLEYIKNDLELDYLKYVQWALIFVTFLLEICYHARSAAVCVIIYAIVCILLPKIAGNKFLYGGLVGISTLGSIAFTVIYSAMGKLGIDVTILYKKLLSGREDIWAELWQELLKHPITGIGSSYTLKSFFIFEVHNGLFDILSVHGIPVFLLVTLLLIKRLWELRTTGFAFRPECTLAVAGIYTFLFASFFENGFIVPPYSVIFLTLFIIAEDGVS